MCWQYIASRCAIISVSVEGTLPTILPASKTVFKSADESPKLLMSRKAQNPSVSYGFVFKQMPTGTVPFNQF
jgi:hypothetical protein